MASKASTAFEKNAEDVDRLLEIHADVGGDAQGRRFGLEVLNKSAIVLITAIWEAYCDDLAAEALEHLVANVPSAGRLPMELKKQIAKELLADPNDLAIWGLADDGWKVKARARLATLMVERNRRLNTPKTGQINDLFATSIGLTKVSGSWRWAGISAANASTKLDEYVTLRGEIAHRGASAAGVKKVHVTDYFEHVKRLVRKTGNRVNSYVESATGKSL